jgi:CRP/FNR family transcriptional regulator, cyclic AMP receptor protein
MLLRRDDRKLQLLKKVPLFDECTNAELAQIATLASAFYVPPGTPVIREGAPGEDLIVLVDGTAEVTRKGRAVDTIGPGDFVGEIALVAGRPRNAMVRTTSKTLLLSIDSRRFWRLLEITPMLQMRILASLAGRLGQA